MTLSCSKIVESVVVILFLKSSHAYLILNKPSQARYQTKEIEEKKRQTPLLALPFLFLLYGYLRLHSCTKKFSRWIICSWKINSSLIIFRFSCKVRPSCHLSFIPLVSTVSNIKISFLKFWVVPLLQALCVEVEVSRMCGTKSLS